MTVTIKAWQLALGVGALLAVSVLALNHARSTSAEDKRQTEAAQLAQKGLIVAQQDSESFKSLSENLNQENAELHLQVAQLQKSSPGAKVVQEISATTKPGIAENHPESGTQCLLKPGDSLRIDIGEAELKTKAGNYVLAGVARCLRIDSGTDTELISAPFEQDTQFAVKPNVELPKLGWGIGPMGSLSTHGTAYGVVVSPPPVRVFGLSFELVVGASVGTAGLAATGGILVRH